MGELTIVLFIAIGAGILAMNFAIKMSKSIQANRPDLPAYSIIGLTTMVIGLLFCALIIGGGQKQGMEGMGQGLLMLLGIICVLIIFGIVVFVLFLRALIEDRPIYYPLGSIGIAAFLIVFVFRLLGGG